MRIFEKRQIPNILSVIRFLMIPCFVFMFFSNVPHNRILALGIFLLAGITDVVDGYLARKNNWITDFGKMMDPIADKLMQATAFVCIATDNRLYPYSPYICQGTAYAGRGYCTCQKAKDLWFRDGTASLPPSFCNILRAAYLFYDNETLVAIMSIVSAAAMLFSLFMYLVCVYLKYNIKTDISADKDSGH